mmetsp:Transcript_13992/g.31436  ORF Transcript_13992/g.31436 Transcript_13992/m.31436 type:complete len:489 (-) Transcript_13992:4-1470(-)
MADRSNSSSKSRWRIVGGADKGGIVVRTGRDTTTEQCAERLATGAIVEEVDLAGDRLCFRKISGNGPAEGWISVKLKDKDLAIKMPVAEADPAAPAAEEAEEAGSATVSVANAGLPLEDVDALLVKHFGSNLAPAAPGAYKGGQLPVMPRTVGLPTYAAVPEKMRSTFKDRPIRKPMIRLYAFTGVADNYLLWLGLATAAPEWCEVAVFEPRAHGFREGEEWDKTLEERADDAFKVMLPALLTHAKGGVSEGAPFGFVSHGIGSVLMVLVAERVRRQLALEPRVVFVNDGPPPDLNMLSDAGLTLLRKDPVEFYQRFQPDTYAQYKQFGGSQRGEVFLERWWRGLRLFEEHSKKLAGQEPYHRFRGELHVLVASTTLALNDVDLTSLPEKERKFFKDTQTLTGSAPENITAWDKQGFDSWRRWAEDEGDFHMHLVETDHMSIKNHPLMLRLLFRELAGHCGMSEECEQEFKRLKWVDNKGRDVNLAAT